jgi:hypothetical protein
MNISPRSAVSRSQEELCRKIFYELWNDVFIHIQDSVDWFRIHALQTYFLIDLVPPEPKFP